MTEAGYGTEYTDNYGWDDERTKANPRTKSASGLFDGTQSGSQAPQVMSFGHPGTGMTMASLPPSQQMPPGRDPAVFESQQYPSVFRETVVRKDDRGKYIDPYKNITTKPCGRKLMYDPTHPDKMYGSMWSSELADMPGPYSFPTTTGLDPEIPWTKDMEWQAEGEVGQWPTEQWKNWTNVAQCPTYDGHDDQIEYHKYKVQVP